MRYVLCIIMGYLTGTINPSYIIAKLRGFDIREKGSRNAGASNALILFGKVIGIAGYVEKGVEFARGEVFQGLLEFIGGFGAAGELNHRVAVAVTDSPPFQV